MGEQIRFTAGEEDVGRRLDQLLGEEDAIASRSAAQKLCESGLVTVGERPVGKNHRLRLGDVVLVTLPEPETLDLTPEDIPLDIVFEDADLLVVNKPRGMVVHPAVGNLSGTLVNALLYHCAGGLSGINGVIRPGIVHRIDKDTSGLLLVAKSDVAHLSLSAQIKAHSCDRFYEAVVHGSFRDEGGTVDAPIGRHPERRKEMAVTEKNAREAVTHYRVVGRYEGFTHLRLQLETGRTHQIRVHMAYLGHPVAGDPLYGPKKGAKSLGGQCLHARAIAFDHPRTGERMAFESPLPDYFTRFLSTLRGAE